VELRCLFSALSVDVASDYVFHDCYNLLDNHPRFGHDFANMVRGVLKGLWIFMQSKRLEAIMLSLPRWLSDRNTVIRKYNKLLDVCFFPLLYDPEQYTHVHEYRGPRQM
jgi:hypothetical protein